MTIQNGWLQCSSNKLYIGEKKGVQIVNFEQVIDHNLKLGHFRYLYFKSAFHLITIKVQQIRKKK